MNRQCEESARDSFSESTGQFSQESRLPTLLTRFPEARAIFNHYRLRGCEGHSGPAETLRFFVQQLSLDAHPKLAGSRDCVLRTLSISRAATRAIESSKR
jgi:hypothetical protein